MFNSPESVIVPKKENRLIPRYPLRLSIRVEVKTGRKVTWEEKAQVNDASAFGAGVILQRPIKRGRIVLLSLALPRDMRRYDFDAEEYQVWGIVRRCIQINEGKDGAVFAVGFAFIGQNPPEAFAEHPTRIYGISHGQFGSDGFWQVIDPAGKYQKGSVRNEQRKESRFPIPEELVLEVLDESGECITSETTIAENISMGGAVVLTEFFADVGTFLRVTSKRCDIEIISIVRGRHQCPGDTSRLNIEFIDRIFPLEGIG